MNLLRVKGKSLARDQAHLERARWTGNRAPPAPPSSQAELAPTA